MKLSMRCDQQCSLPAEVASLRDWLDKGQIESSKRDSPELLRLQIVRTVDCLSGKLNEISKALARQVKIDRRNSITGDDKNSACGIREQVLEKDLVRV